MIKWCVVQLDWIFWLALAFLAASLLLGTLRAIGELVRSGGGGGGQKEGRTENVSLLQPILDGLKGVIEALVNAPAWFALFLAGIFLLWVASEVHVEACKPAMPVTKVTIDTKTVITKTLPAPAPVVPPQRQTNLPR